MEIINVSVAREFGITQIDSKSTWERIWDSIDSILLNSPNSVVVLDFKGVILRKLEESSEFLSMLSNDRIYMRFESASSNYMESLRKNVEMLAMFCHVEEEDMPKKLKFVCTDNGDSYKRISTENVGKYSLVRNIKNSTEVNGDKATVKLRNVVSTISQKNTIDCLKSAILELDNVKRVDVETDQVNINSNVYRYMASIVLDLDKEGVEVNYISSKKRMLDDIEAYKSNLELDCDTVIVAIKSLLELPLNSVVALTKYRETKGVDDFGRSGKGEEPLWSKIAIYRGLVEDSKLSYSKFRVSSGKLVNGTTLNVGGQNIEAFHVAAIFDTYNSSEFSTLLELYMKDDIKYGSGKPPKPERINSKLLSESSDGVVRANIGMFRTIGRYYHVHYISDVDGAEVRKNMVTGVQIIDGKQRTINTKVNLAERVAIVADDWGLKINQNLLKQDLKVLAEMSDALDED